MTIIIFFKDIYPIIKITFATSIDFRITPFILILDFTISLSPIIYTIYARSLNEITNKTYPDHRHKDIGSIPTVHSSAFPSHPLIHF